ncbi:MAG: serine protease [Actinobacteria bacterium]|nr:serine protease [Actinomycetota bacterium]
MSNDDASWRERLPGARERLGWWTLPMFLIVGLAGSVLAGSLAAVYYGQQVSGLEEETRSSRAELRGAVQDVERAREEALAEIEDEVESVREALTREFPFEDVTTSGVVALRAVTGTSSQGQQQAPAGGGEADGAVFAQETTEPGEPTATDEPQQDPATSPSPSPPPSPPPSGPREERFATGFAVASDRGTTFIATVHSLIADPDAPGGVVGEVEVITPRGTARGIVHSWDAGRDLALIRADIGEVPLLAWRPSGEALGVGERLIAAGVTPTLNTVQVAGQVAYTDVTVLVTDLPHIDFLRGAPIVDPRGLVVGVYTTEYRPFGSSAGERQGSAPAQLLCERMLRNCEALEAEPEE